MFDPSKLDLDLDENLDNNSKKEVEKKSIETTNKELKPENNDVLGNLNDSISDKLENDSVIKKFEEPNSNEEKKEDTENTQNEKNIEVWRTEYEKSIIKEKKEIKKEEAEDKIIFDINITSLDILLAIIVDKEYDFATFEPMDIDSAVKITFRKDKIVKEIRYIKYPIYTNILINAKVLTKLTVEETSNEQEWSWEKIIRNKNFKILTKVVPSDLWSKLFIKASYLEKKLEKKEVKKTSLSEIFTFLSAIAFIALVIWWGFIWFIVLNAKSIEDVKFFYSLWINLNEINSFIGQAISIIFSILIFIETIFLVIYLFKFSLTKKEFKQRKIRLWIISTIILILTFSTASVWMIIDRQIKSLPNWQEMAYWDVQLYDNSKLLSESFDKEWAILEDTSDLIWPVEIKFDLSFFDKKEEQKWMKTTKYMWDFWNWDTADSPTPTVIYNFNQKWNYKVSLNIEQVDLEWNVTTKEVDNIPNVNISYVVEINEKKLNNWWKMVDFNATSLKELGKIEWFFIDNLDEPIWTWEIFRIWKPIFEETLVWMYIKRNDKESDKLDKLFIITWEDKVNLSWEIKYTRWVIDDLEYEIKLINLENDFWNWYIEEYKWLIWDKEITKVWDVTDPEKASTINYKFQEYWDHKISVILKDSAWETKTITTNINVTKDLKLSKELQISNNWVVLNNVNYDQWLNEYYINEIWTPTTIKLDARFIKPNNLLYTLKNVEWDYNSDWDIDEVNKLWEYTIAVEWNHVITVYYEFAHRKIADDIVKLKEQIYIEWIKKEAIIDFKINKDSDYVPVVVWFDASISQVKNENIEKFIWDYDDWIVEERDSIVQWHRYTEPWNYRVKVTVVTSSWKEYFKTKDLILKPKPQSVKIKTSMKVAPIWQWIDFLSDESEWQIIWYFWDFWDWEVSTEANPTHSYKKEWKYTISLKLDYSNKNILEDKLEIEITK
jgi:PKD repeat protein